MTRTVEALDGLALLGRARVGDLAFETPGLIESPVDGVPLASPGFTTITGPSGTRRLRLTDGTGRLDLDLPVLAPEVMGPPAAPLDVGPGTVLVHPPFSESAPRDRPIPEMVVLGNSRALWGEGEPFVAALAAVRQRSGGAAILWTPRLALPHRVPLLTYLGVDLVDTTEGLIAAAAGTFLDPALGSLDVAVARGERLCTCPACGSDPPGSLAGHTVHAYRRAVRETRTAIRAGRLRELVESRLTSEPALAEMLRYADRELATPLDERTPVVGSGSRNYVLAEAHRRPEMVRFRRRLLERYRPPPSKTVLLLVPCSKTKPYRRSRSHRRFATAFEELPGAERVHIVSVSSPIGLVPRELEDVPPARHYDIPVTGDWTEPERESVVAGLRHLLDTGSYRSVIVHLDPEEYPFVRPSLDGPVPARWTLTNDRTTSAEALHELREATRQALASERPVPGGPLAVVREELRALAAVQLGPGAADRLCAPPLRLAGRPWFQRLTDGSSDLATVREERGLLHLTVAGARRLMPDPPLAVTVDPNLRLTGDLFAPGVRAADPAIRAGDSVVLVREGRLAGVGEALLPGPLMVELRHGLAVRVRHRSVEPTDTPKAEERPRSPAGR